MCAFEIDDTDEFFESGWSVVAIGRLELATGRRLRSHAVREVPSTLGQG